MSDDTSVTDLVTSARSGDKQAWDALVKRYAPLIWSICRQYRLDDSGIEDVGQAVWLRLVEHLADLRDPAALPGWLATTTRRECCRVQRATSRLPAGGRVLGDMPAAQTKTAEHELLVTERHAALREALARLPLSGQRLLSMLSADPPLPYTEISARLGIPVGSIGPHRHRYLDRAAPRPGNRPRDRGLTSGPEVTYMASQRRTNKARHPIPCDARQNGLSTHSMPAACAELGNLHATIRSFRPISRQYGIGARFAHALERRSRYVMIAGHLCEARDLAEGRGGNWIAAGSRVQLGILAVLRGRLDEARPVLDEALDLSLAARSTPFVTLCLSAYAQLALAEGDPDQAALLEGAAEGLRRRVGPPAWPHLRRVEAKLVAQVRHRLAADRFDQAFSAGSSLTQREAVAIVRDQRGTGTPAP